MVGPFTVPIASGHDAGLLPLVGGPLFARTTLPTGFNAKAWRSLRSGMAVAMAMRGGCRGFVRRSPLPCRLSHLELSFKPFGPVV